MSHGGASRWIDLGFISFQPSELLKIAFIIYLAAWISFAKDKIQTVTYGLIPYISLLAIISTLLFIQRDTDTLAVIAFTGILMLVIGGAKFKHIFIALILLAGFIGLVIFTRPYALERVKTYINRGADSQGAGYQINQSLIAIGSGKYFGRGFGQSIQKFGYLPQPTDDSIFAVAGEEFGFFGTTIIILLYVFFGFSAFRLGIRIHDNFGTSLVMGISILILTESFLNISAMIGITPLSGLPLLFMSHGGTALIVTLMSAGIIASVSRHEIKQVS
jgi:cell division protein FtsW